jgi:hypothetical protein
VTTKADADYTPQASNPAESCAKCRHFDAPDKCDKVKGEIAPVAWCKYWAAIRLKARTTLQAYSK